MNTPLEAYRIRASLLPISLITLTLVSSAACQAPQKAPTVPAQPTPAQSAPAQPSQPTIISISTKVIHSKVKRLGINLSGESYYDSGIMLRDLTFRNPGFEGEIWQTILQCKFVKGDSCADQDEWSGWPVDFAKGGTFDFFYGAAKGETGIVTGNTLAASAAHQGVWISFGRLAVHPQVGDFYILRLKIPGDAAAGWGVDLKGGATADTEFKDLSSNSPGKQALRLNAPGLFQSASVGRDIDTYEGRSFLQLNGVYTLSFRAKGTGGVNHLSAAVTRMSSRFGLLRYLAREVPLTSSWQDFQFTFTTHESGSVIGPLRLSLEVHGSSALIDDATLTEANSPDNPTVFRNAVVERLRELRPGILRFMDNGASFGSTIDNLLAPPLSRQRSGFAEGSTRAEDISIGLHEFLVLCQTVKSDPWFVVPAGISPIEMRNLIEYFSGSATTPYGAKRAALGQPAPWTLVFSTIHLELGNETWNWGSFAGEGIPDPKAYATRASQVFSAARSSRLYEAGKFDLIMNGWSDVPWYNEQELSIKSYADSFDIAPYTFNSLNDMANNEAIFGPMFAEPESLDSRPDGRVNLNAKLAGKYGVKLAVYEVNLSTVQGKASESALDSTVPSLGAGLSVADHMLLMLRDDGIIDQAVFALPEYANGFENTEHPGSREMVKLWGTVVDMGGQTNRVRPTFLAEELANTAIADRMIETEQSGSNPTWDQPESSNGKIKLKGAHLIQSFAFTDGSRCSLVLFNLSRSEALPVILSGSVAPHSAVHLSRLTSAKLTDSNEVFPLVSIKQEDLPAFDPSAPYSLPPYSMTVLSWQVSGLRFAETHRVSEQPVAHVAASASSH